MFPDVHLEADLLRSALLVGLVRELEVSARAEALLPMVADAHGQLAEVMLAPSELTALREALRPLAEPTDALAVGAALLAFRALDPAATTLTATDQLRVLSLIRREEMLPASVASAIKHFEDRLMLASVQVPLETAPTGEEVLRWLNSVRPTPYFRVFFEGADEDAAFLAALSRKVVRDRRWHRDPATEGARAWIVRSPGAPRSVLILNETLWQVAVREFSPLPIGSRLPYRKLPEGAVVALDEDSAASMGADEAVVRLAP